GRQGRRLSRRTTKANPWRRREKDTAPPPITKQYLCAVSRRTTRGAHWNRRLPAEIDRFHQPCNRPDLTARSVPATISPIPQCLDHVVAARCRRPRPCFVMAAVAADRTR